MDDNENSIQSFDDLMDLIGKNGTFQKRFNLIFNFALVVCISMANINIVIAMSVPDHWCKVPGQNLTNYTEEEWKMINIPIISEINCGTKTAYQKCNMYHYNITNQTSDNPKKFSNITGCHYGWEYDKTWFKETIPSSENWVCSESLKVSNTFAVMRIADVLGTFVCGQLGDVIGRQPIFVISVLFVVIGNLMFTFTSTYYPVFLVAAFTAGFTSYTAYQAPLVIGMEISREKDKAYIAMLQNVGRTVGLCILPPFMWLMGYWRPFMIMSTLPCLLFFIPYRYIIESPRWLMTKEKSTKSLKVMKRIAKINRSKIPEDAPYILRSSHETRETTYGAMSLFSSWTMARNTSCLVICWVVSFTTYLIMTLNISNVEGNPFLNFVYQGAIELPAIILGKHFSDKIGRKLTNVGSFFATILGCIPILYIIKGSNAEWILITCVIFLKFAIMLSYYVVGLQSVEMYPTCLRQTGIAVGGLSASALATLAPYVVHLGTSVDGRYPYIIIAGLGALGLGCGLLLPETRHNSPDTLEDAKSFGNNQKCFEFSVVTK